MNNNELLNKLLGIAKLQVVKSDWWQQILNYFDGRFNNGFAEGVNLKIKMLNRCGYGCRNFNSFRLHVWSLSPSFPVKNGRACLF